MKCGVSALGVAGDMDAISLSQGHRDFASERRAEILFTLLTLLIAPKVLSDSKILVETHKHDIHLVSWTAERNVAFVSQVSVCRNLATLRAKE